MTAEAIANPVFRARPHNGVLNRWNPLRCNVRALDRRAHSARVHRDIRKVVACGQRTRRREIAVPKTREVTRSMTLVDSAGWTRTYYWNPTEILTASLKDASASKPFSST